jgi:hypothetical protein
MALSPPLAFDRHAALCGCLSISAAGLLQGGLGETGASRITSGTVTGIGSELSQTRRRLGWQNQCGLLGTLRCTPRRLSLVSRRAGIEVGLRCVPLAALSGLRILDDGAELFGSRHILSDQQLNQCDLLFWLLDLRDPARGMGRISTEGLPDDALSTGGVFAVLPCRPLIGLCPLGARLVAAAHSDKEEDAAQAAQGKRRRHRLAPLKDLSNLPPAIQGDGRRMSCAVRCSV